MAIKKGESLTADKNTGSFFSLDFGLDMLSLESPLQELGRGKLLKRKYNLDFKTMG